jgi:hypothetical protein
VFTDVSAKLQHQQLAHISAMADACRANGRPVSSFHFHAYAKTDQAASPHDIDLGDYVNGQGSVSGGQRYTPPPPAVCFCNNLNRYFHVPFACEYRDGRPADVVDLHGKLCSGGAGGNTMMELRNVREEDKDLVNPAFRCVAHQMEKSLQGQRVRYQVPKFQMKITYSLPGRLTCDDVEDVLRVCDESPELRELTRVVQPKEKKAPQLLMLYCGDTKPHPWNAQVNRGFVIVHEW